MAPRLRAEALLLVVTALPPLTTALLLWLATPTARAFVEIQVIAGTLYAAASLGTGTMLASMPLPPPRQVPRAFRTMPSAIVLAIVAATATMAPGSKLVPAGLVAVLAVAASLYRIPGRLLTSRVLLIAQFLPLAGPAGQIALLAVVVLAHIHLVRLRAFAATDAASRIGSTKLLAAWGVSSVKELFLRGHYVALHALGLAGVEYANVLKFVDLVSRPSDYLFQRLVDLDRLSARLKPLLLASPFVGLFSALAATLLLGWVTGAGVAWIAATSALVFVVKFLSFRHNLRLRHAQLAGVYVTCLVLAAPLLLLRLPDAVLPASLGALPYFVSALVGAAIWLGVLR